MINIVLIRNKWEISVMTNDKLELIIDIAAIFF